MIYSILAFQLIYGAVVFGLTRNYYHREVAVDVPVDRLSDRPRTAPHGVPRTAPTTGVARLPGSERFTVEDARRMVASAPPDNDYGAGSSSTTSLEDLARRADQHFQEGLFERAAEEYSQLLAHAPDNIDLYNNLALTLHYMGRSPEAVENLEKGIALDSGNQRIWLTLGFVQTGVGNTAAASRAFGEAIEIDPGSQVGREASRLLAALPR
ncbi:MAG: tetratricopeptide repeat protein [Gammaproteobacteria bacterium]|nr:tetratricopeptide repeat protein [Gammaproteobacteria bacterium]